MNMKINPCIFKQSLITYFLRFIFPYRCLLVHKHKMTPFMLFLSQTPVVIDSIADDACWEDAQWHPIDQVWIPYGATMNEGDFQGRYKLACLYSNVYQNELIRFIINI